MKLLPHHRLSVLFNHPKKRFIPFILCGDPTSKYTLQAMHSLVDSGADAIEIGIPFTDPIADGAVLTRAHTRSCAQGVTITQVFETVHRFRRTNQKTPLVLMGYYNPCFQFGFSAFCHKAAKHGVDGLILVDCPNDGKERVAIEKLCAANQIAFIPLVSLNSSISTIKTRCLGGSGYCYLVAVDGVTGSSAINIKNINSTFKRIKKHASLPIAIGFGINSLDRAKQLYRFADTIIIGTHLASLQESSKGNMALSLNKIKTFCSQINQIF
ncbi:MAG: tryptophan synthase subunit alpha [Methylacidiphilales bacterium]|nr:tryptophan synthase subunit alpha [Candidatus Methylacidiphilales bacterium]